MGKKLASLLNRIQESLREKKKERIEKICFDLSLSLFYCKYSVIKQLLSITECLKIEKDDEKNEYLVYICE